MRKDVNDMFEIKGKVTTAICYAKVIEDEAIEQIRRMCDYDLTRGSKVRIMPDVHAGKGCTIGTTMTITDKICPNIVLYGHTHDSNEDAYYQSCLMKMVESDCQHVYKTEVRAINVGCMKPWMNYEPRTLTELLSYPQ